MAIARLRLIGIVLIDIVGIAVGCLRLLLRVSDVGRRLVAAAAVDNGGRVLREGVVVAVGAAAAAATAGRVHRARPRRGARQEVVDQLLEEAHRVLLEGGNVVVVDLANEMDHEEVRGEDHGEVVVVHSVEEHQRSRGE